MGSRTNFTIALLTLLAAPAALAAQYEGHPTPDAAYNHFSYTLGDVRLLAVDPDAGDNAGGVRLGGWAQFLPNFFGVGAVSTVSQGGANGLDTDRLDGAVGYRYPIMERVDLVGIGGLRYVHVSNSNFSDSDVGPLAIGGARFELTPLVELGGYVTYTDVLHDNRLAANGEGLYRATRNLSLLAGLGIADHERNATLGARWNFSTTRY